MVYSTEYEEWLSSRKVLSLENILTKICNKKWRRTRQGTYVAIGIVLSSTIGRIRQRQSRHRISSFVEAKSQLRRCSITDSCQRKHHRKKDSLHFGNILMNEKKEFPLLKAQV